MNKNNIIYNILFFLIFGTIFSYTVLLSWKIDCDHLSETITIEKGDTVSSVSRILENNLCLNSIIFKIAMKITFNDKNLKYGRYDLKSAENVRDLINMLTSVSSERTRITIIEGLRLQQIALIFADKMNLDIEKFISLCYDRKFIKSLNLDSDVSSLEGYLFPDTYIFLNTYTESDVIKILVKQFIYNFNEYVRNNTKLSKNDIVILASIIQGEAYYSDEMRKISSVYHNRLKKNMLLQADPTIQYALPKHKKRILYDDTQIESKYNTYLYKGLPPGPINSPGIDALQSAANPETTKFLYFVSDKKGRHIFNVNYKDHLRSK